MAMCLPHLNIKKSDISLEEAILSYALESYIKHSQYLSHGPCPTSDTPGAWEVLGSCPSVP